MNKEEEKGGLEESWMTREEKKGWWTGGEVEDQGREEGLKDWRTGGQEDWRTGGKVDDQGRVEGLKDCWTGGNHL